MKKITWVGKDTLEYTKDAVFTDESLGDSEVLLRVKAVGLCSTDIHIVQGKVHFSDFPQVLGHEIAGVIEKTGKAVTKVEPDDRVTVDSVVGCGVCRFCLRGSTQYCREGYEIGVTVDGGMQEFIRIPEKNAIPIPDCISFEEAAILDTEVYGALAKPGIEAGSTLLVLGPGPGGLVAVQIGRLLGAGKVILAGTRPERINLGKKLGADYALEVQSPDFTGILSEITGGYGPDIVFETAGTAESTDMAIDLVAVQGKVVLYGVRGTPIPSFDADRITLKDLVVYGALSDRVGWGKIIGWIADGSLNLKDIITHRFSFKNAQEAYETVRDRKGGAIKAVLFP